jgi:hypothetical protein
MMPIDRLCTRPHDIEVCAALWLAAAGGAITPGPWRLFVVLTHPE